MIQKAADRLLRQRHFWRDITFDELSQLYISMMCRSLALSFVGIFVPIYLYTLGHALFIILAFFGICYLFVAVGNLLGAFNIARYGPKRTMAVSYILHVGALILLALMEHSHISIWVVAALLGLANGMFFIAYHVNFSKIKHSRHGGKEIGYMTIVEKIGGVIGPLAGGIIATLFSPEYTFLSAIVLFVIGLVPLTATGETVRLNQKLELDKHDLMPFIRDIIASVGLNIHGVMITTVWPLYMAVVVFSSGVFLKIGGLTTLSAFAMITVAYIVGKLVDSRKGRLLLKVGAIASALIHICRPFVTSVSGIVAISIGQEVGDVSARLPYTKGLYDAADYREKHRILYMLTVEMMASLGKATVMGLLAIIAMSFHHAVFAAAFIFAACGSLLIMTERFPALNPRKYN